MEVSPASDSSSSQRQFFGFGFDRAHMNHVGRSRPTHSTRAAQDVLTERPKAKRTPLRTVVIASIGYNDFGPHLTDVLKLWNPNINPGDTIRNATRLLIIEDYRLRIHTVCENEWNEGTH
jgi:hypothetical protein